MFGRGTGSGSSWTVGRRRFDIGGIMFQRVADWFTNGLEQTLQVAKSVSLIATIVGAYYFIAYLGALGVPFPADFSVLPSILLAIGVVTVGITAIVFIYILLAGWILLDPFNMGYADLIHMRSSGLIGHGGRAAVTSIIAIYLVPYLAWVAVLFFVPSKNLNSYSVWLLFAFAVWACLVAFVKLRDIKESAKRQRLVLFGKISLSVFLLSYFSILSSLVYVILLEARGLMNSWDQIALSLVAFASINLGVLYPSINTREFNKVNQEAFAGKSLDSSTLVKRIYKAPVLLAVGFLVCISLLPPFSASVGELPIRVLGLSSNESRLIYADAKTGNVWPPELQAECNDDHCRSVPVVVALDLGKYLYVRPKDGAGLYRLERNSIVEHFNSEDEEAEAERISPGAGTRQSTSTDSTKPRG